MSEIRPGPMETLPKVETSPELNNEQEKPELARVETAPESPAVDDIREAIDTHAVSSENYGLESQNKETPAQFYGVQHELKTQAYNRGLNNIRQQLPLASRTFSKVVHQPVVDATSNVVAATIGRPVALLLGASTALIGAVILIYASKHYGFRYNYLLVFLLFLVGFTIGLVFELIKWLSTRRQPRL